MFLFDSKAAILVVDDDPAVLRTLQRILERKGYRVIANSSSENALEFLKTEPVQLLITDYRMAEMDGIQLLQEAKKLYPSLPVVMITGFATINNAIDTIRLGAFDYLRKPLEIKKIYEVVERALSSTQGQ